MDVFATFDLTQVPVGVYRLELSQSYTISKIALDSPEPIVADTQRVVATLANAFTVLEAQPDNTVMIWTVPFLQRRESQGLPFYLTFTNRGSHDVPAPLFEVSTHADVAFFVSPLSSGHLPQQGAIQVFALGTQGPAGIVHPGDTVLVLIESRAPSPRLLATNVWQVPADETPIDYQFVFAAMGLDPATDAGMAVLGVLTDRYGTTWSSLQAGLREEATRLSLQGQRIDTVLGLLAETAAMALADFNEQVAKAALQGRLHRRIATAG